MGNINHKCFPNVAAERCVASQNHLSYIPSKGGEQGYTCRRDYAWRTLQHYSVLQVWAEFCVWLGSQNS